MIAHLTRTEEQKVQLAQEVIAYLNEVLALDPQALHDLIEHREVVNQQLAAHPTTQVGVSQVGDDQLNPALPIAKSGMAPSLTDEDPPKAVDDFIPLKVIDHEQDTLVVGVLGLLNGLVGVRDDHWGYITAIYGDDDKLQRFVLTKREGDVEVKEAMHPDVGEHPVTDIDASMLINGNRRSFVEGIQYYLNELLDDDSPLHVIGHIESLCRDYEKLIRDAVKVYGTDSALSLVKPEVVIDEHPIKMHARWMDRSGHLIIIRDSHESTTSWKELRPDGSKGVDRFMTTAGFRRAYRWVIDL